MTYFIKYFTAVFNTLQVKWCFMLCISFIFIFNFNFILPPKSSNFPCKHNVKMRGFSNWIIAVWQRLSVLCLDQETAVDTNRECFFPHIHYWHVPLSICPYLWSKKAWSEELQSEWSDLTNHFIVSTHKCYSE